MRRMRGHVGNLAPAVADLWRMAEVGEAHKATKHTTDPNVSLCAPPGVLWRKDVAVVEGWMDAA